MTGEGSFIRMNNKLAAYIQKNVSLAGIQNRDEVLDLFDKMHQLFPQWVIMTCPVMHPEIAYVSENYAYVFDSCREVSLNHSFEKYFSCVHDADREDLHKCFAYMQEYIESIPPALHCEYRVVFHYRFRKKSGQYIYLHDEKAVLHLKGSGNLYYTLSRDITGEKIFGGVKMEIYRQEKLFYKIKEYRPSAEHHTISKREGELLTLIQRGLSTKEIAWYLNISHHTVRNIKSKLFEKYRVNNSIELLNMSVK